MPKSVLGCVGFPLRVAALVVWASTAALAGEIELPVPEGVFPPEVPADNPPTAAKVELGRKLYFDARLSTDGTIACASCHDPRQGFADPRGEAASAGVGGAVGTRNAPTVLNAAFLVSQFWDGRAETLEEQAVQPLFNPIEHGFPDADAVMARLRELADYPALFARAFGSEQPTLERVGQAIASFERTLISLDAPIDRFLAGDEGAISESARRGWELYNAKARCNTCHGHIDVLPLFTDDLFHNIGVGVERIDFDAVARRAAAAVAGGTSVDELALSDAEASELGRFLVTREPKDMGAFKTPQLRNVALTAPYMHDGSEATLADVIAFYDRGGNDNPYLDGGMRPLNLTEQESADLVELLETFTSGDLERFEPLHSLVP
ncbi:MAG: cytochrome-c peroxidase [Proteobacteria bacterium]|nr:cytochrome-c peroxidase [Pseudomonadota bacterium]